MPTMTQLPLIKICGIRTPELAKKTAIAGAHFIGIVFHPQSKRHVSIEQAISIAAATKKAGAIPVAVFVNHTAWQMHEICQVTGIEVIQLHGQFARRRHQLLSAHYQRIYALPVTSNGLICGDGDDLFYCDPKRDYVLFDNAEAGKGLPFDWNKFSHTSPFRIGFAGGLTAENVTHAIHKFQPSFVDVSSGVENAAGEKDLKLIQQFIAAVHGS
jgi:phosphoribosylanthranilate isomerase